jgi:hypothetical protein
MWPKFVIDSVSKPENMSLRELEEKIYEITNKQNQIINCNLSLPIETAALMELEEQKKQYKELMHKKVEEL